jgi:hypothetical protein
VTGARVAGVVLLIALVAAAPVHASEVSAPQLRALAARAADDPAALRQLREVDAVDGRKVDIAGALRGARGPALQARLQALAASAPAAPAGGEPRRNAREVLAQKRFHGESVPGPFRGLLHRLEQLVPDLRPLLRWLDDILPGGRSVVWLVLAALVGGLAWRVARRLLTRRISVAAAAAQAAAPADDPKALERRAAEAEAAGELARALRLRFRAGLLRLDARGAIAFRPSISTQEVRRSLRSEDFDALAATFDDVVYGGRPAQPGDVVAARERWPAVVSGAHREDE